MPSIRFFNTLTAKTDDFSPQNPREVGIYTCGPTVYDFAHIGNFRAFVFEDLLRRFLEFSGFNVKHVMNLTDVDDKTIQGAQRHKSKLKDYTAKYIEAFREDLKTLNCLPPHVQPRATEKIKQMQDLIQQLIQKDLAYTKEGSVYYRVAKFSDYGKLSKKKMEMNIAGASERVDSDEYESKEQVSDFVLWKAAKEGEDALGAAWDSPWGKGRPGWHIECSAMSLEALGSRFDIHAGGEDLIFPHHENEIAQSEGATGEKPFVKYWLHCKFLLVDGEKMSKSKGNFHTLRDLLNKGADPAAVRWALLATHYHTALNFTLEGLKEAAEHIKKMDECYFQLLSRKKCPAANSAFPRDFYKQATDKIQSALSEDLNISVALALLLEVLSTSNREIGKMSAGDLEAGIDFFKKMDRLLGFNVAEIESIPDEIFDKIRMQQDFRKIKDFAQADKMRQQIAELGWLVKDGRPGEPATLKKKRRVWDK